MKKHLHQFILSSAFIVLHSFCFSQNSIIDSLLNVLKTAKEDTVKVKTLNKLFLEYEFSDSPKALFFLNKSLELALKTGYKRGLSSVYTYRGYYFEDLGNYPEALKNYFTALEIFEAIKDKSGVAASNNNIGIVYKNQGNYPEALKRYFTSLKIREEFQDKKGIAATYNNIGNVYDAQGNYTEALRNHLICLNIKKSIRLSNGQFADSAGIATSYNNIGNAYFFHKEYEQALENHIVSLKIRESLHDKEGLAQSYNNIGGVYFEQGEREKKSNLRIQKFQQALANFTASLKIEEESENKAGLAISYINIGNVYLNQNKHDNAKKYLCNSKFLAQEIGSKELMRDVFNALRNLDSLVGNFKGAYENHKLYILYRDSIDNEETRKKTIQSQMTFDFEKKEAATKAGQDKKDAVSKADRKRQQIFFWFVAAFAISIGIIALVILRGLNQSKKAKKLIELQRDEIFLQKESEEHQKLLVEEHQKEIIDSITYAKRIQHTLLANKQLLDKNLSQSPSPEERSYFVLFKPKDIVSGDFYWATEKIYDSPVNNGKKMKRFYIAACDSTGHGVPGAFMSLLNISFLNEAVNEKNILEPHKILNHVRKRLIENMDGGQDGMDCVLICIETNLGQVNGEKPVIEKGSGAVKITYAAANNSPTIIKNGISISLDADKMPVGKGEKAETFTLRTIDFSGFSRQKEKLDYNDSESLESKVGSLGEDLGGASLYLYTDGYADQFGGPKGKKFKYKQLDELLVSISNLPSDKQSEIMDNRFEEWKGHLEQIDDVLIIGIKLG